MKPINKTVLTGTLIDIQPISEEDRTKIKLFFKDENNNIFTYIDDTFYPYFFIISRQDQINFPNAFKISKANYKKNPLQIKKFVNTDLTDEEIEKGNYNIFKIEFKTIKELVNSRDFAKNNFNGKLESDIPFVLRYMLDKKIKPLYKYKIEKGKFTELHPDFQYNMLAIDIETLGKEINMKKNPIVLISLYNKNFKKVITYKKPKYLEDYVDVVENEKELLLRFLQYVKELKTHILITYNGDSFDLPYIKKRAKILGIENELNTILNYTPHKNKDTATCYIDGIQHIDSYRIVTHLSKIGALKLIHYKLDDVYFYLFGKHKVDLKYHEMEEIYNNEERLHEFIFYNLIDSKAVYEITENFLMQYIKLAQTVGKTLQETIRSSTSSLVETKLMFKTIEKNKIIPNLPNQHLVKYRETLKYEGAYVKTPEIGLHENIAVLDFRSFHPSIIITFNISPETLNLKSCKYKEISPSGDEFCQDEKATIPEMLEEILNMRIKIKEKMKKLNKNSLEYKILYAEQWSLKILLNSTYGYLAYARSRWYCFECARSTLKYTHKYIKYVFEEAKKFNLKTIYSDTDSAFVIYKNKEDVFNFLDYINKKLPGVLYLSLDNFYKRGIFVSKKQSKGSAKKRYALLDEKDNLKIAGFESVRRDWANIAKETQEKVLEIILKEGDPKKALDYVKEQIKKLKEHKININSLVIINKIRKPIEEYDSIGPHIAAVIDAIKRGKKINVGENIEYIITKTGKSISEKAKLKDFVNNNDYDENYYIEHQIIPAISSIFEVFGYTEEKLKSEPEQKTLFNYK